VPDGAQRVLTDAQFEDVGVAGGEDVLG